MRGVWAPALLRHAVLPPFSLHIRARRPSGHEGLQGEPWAVPRPSSAANRVPGRSGEVQGRSGEVGTDGRPHAASLTSRSTGQFHRRTNPVGDATYWTRPSNSADVTDVSHAAHSGPASLASHSVSGPTQRRFRRLRVNARPQPSHRPLAKTFCNAFPAMRLSSEAGDISSLARWPTTAVAHEELSQPTAPRHE